MLTITTTRHVWLYMYVLNHKLTIIIIIINIINHNNFIRGSRMVVCFLGHNIDRFKKFHSIN